MEAPESPNLPEKRNGDSRSVEHFIIEELLNFSNEDAPDDGPFNASGENSAESSTVTVVDSCNSSFSGDTLADSHLPADLCVPYDEMAELEWLSNFVEESFSSDDLQKLHFVSATEARNDPTQDLDLDLSPCNPRNSPIFSPDVSVPGKARSKRARVGHSSWSSHLLAASATSSAPSPSFSSSDSNTPAPLKKKKKPAPAESTTAAEGGGGDGRKCLHCSTEKTPQWRTGPMGPKTLCNACGVRYKAGRLMPEYRPAASPTFVLTKHSNSHRKVMELRRQKEMQQQRFPPPPASSGLFDIVAAAAGEEYLIHHSGTDPRQLI